MKDQTLLRLIRAYLTAGMMEKGVKVKSTEEAPQGGPLSPLLSNIMLNELVMKSVKIFLEDELKLKVNEDKRAAASPARRNFLGYSFYFSKQGVEFRVLSKKAP
jgi:RNA-directed DNA polymerase